MSNDNNSHMTFHESYGSLPKNTLRLVKSKNVSPADFDYMLDQFMFASKDVGDDSPECRATWSEVNTHIIENSPNGYYTPRYF